MSFNWFNRPTQPESEQQPTVPDNPASAESVTASSDTAASSDEMLNYAKQAYENLKKQKQASQADNAPDQTNTKVDAEPAAIVSDAAPENPDDTTIDATAAATVTELDAPSEPAPSESDAVVETPVEAAAPQIYAPPPDDSALPFWARAEADREVRLARLRETAVEAAPPSTATPVTEPPIAPFPTAEASAASVAYVPQPSAPEASPEATPDAASEPVGTPVVLDGDFLWSTEVLAMQGRRPEDISIEEITWLKQLRQGLDRTRRSLVNNLRSIVGQGPLNEAGVMEIESLLLQADVGIEATDRIIEALQNKLKEEALPPEQAIAYLKQILRELLEEPLQGQHRVAFAPEKDRLNIWLITGVNGAGKTTTIGKLTHIAKKTGYKCLIAAADTFRAAAVEQVKVWGQRSEVEVIANPGQNTDPAAVVFDAISAAQSRGTELLLVDTAGRLQNKKNLMDELSKIRRIIDKKTDGAIVESLLVLDATLGQNGLQQAKVFAEAAQLSGVVLTKLDGTAKGGIALAVVQQLGLPIRFIGAGEGIEDLRPFSSYEFVEALVSG